MPVSYAVTATGKPTKRHRNPGISFTFFLGMLLHLQPPHGLVKPSVFSGPVPLLPTGTQIFYQEAFIHFLLLLRLILLVSLVLFINMVTTVQAHGGSDDFILIKSQPLTGSIPQLHPLW